LHYFLLAKNKQTLICFSVGPVWEINSCRQAIEGNFIFQKHCGRQIVMDWPLTTTMHSC